MFTGLELRRQQTVKVWTIVMGPGTGWILAFAFLGLLEAVKYIVFPGLLLWLGYMALRRTGVRRFFYAVSCISVGVLMAVQFSYGLVAGLLICEDNCSTTIHEKPDWKRSIVLSGRPSEKSKYEEWPKPPVECDYLCAELIERVATEFVDFEIDGSGSYSGFAGFTRYVYLGPQRSGCKQQSGIHTKYRKQAMVKAFCVTREDIWESAAAYKLKRETEFIELPAIVSLFFGDIKVYTESLIERRSGKLIANSKEVRYQPMARSYSSFLGPLFFHDGVHKEFRRFFKGIDLPQLLRPET